MKPGSARHPNHDREHPSGRFATLARPCLEQRPHDLPHRLLMADRLANRVLNERANLAWRMMREGQVVLVQRKAPNGDTHYEAVAVNQQQMPFVQS